MSSTTGRWVNVGWFLLTLSSGLLPRAAFAEAPDRQAEAFQLFRAGKEAHDRGDRRAALRAFRAAQEAAPASATLWTIAVLELELGETLQAHRDLQLYIDRAGASIAPQRLQTAMETLRKLEQDLARVRVSTDALGASVQVDGVQVDGWTWLAPGRHLVRAEALGRVSVRREVELQRGYQKEIEISLPLEPEKIEQKEVPRPAKIVPAAGVDGGRRSIGIGVMGIGVSVLAVGGVFGVQAILRGKDADHFCEEGGCGPESGPLVEAGRTAANIANGALVVGTAIASVGVYLVLSSYPGRTSQPAHGAHAATPNVSFRLAPRTVSSGMVLELEVCGDAKNMRTFSFLSLAH